MRLVDRYLGFDELVQYLQATDIYLTPYLNPVQIVSGTLAYAVGLGKAIVSTPYLYAEELLAHGRGFLVQFRDAASIAQTVNALLDDRDLRASTERRAYRFGRPDDLAATWRQEYGSLFASLLPRRRTALATSAYANDAPAASLDHMVAMTDDVGMFQHARFDIPNRSFGYCTDDVARALIVAIEAARDRATEQTGAKLATTYLAFLRDAQLPDGWFHNFMGYDRRWQDDRGTRRLVRAGPFGASATASRARRATPGAGSRASCSTPRCRTWPGCTHLRSLAYAALGLAAVATAEPGDARIARPCALRSRRSPPPTAPQPTPDWRWCEDDDDLRQRAGCARR